MAKGAPKARGFRRWVNAIIWVILFAFVFGGIIFFTPNGLSIFNFGQGAEDEAAILVNGEKIGTTRLDFVTNSIVQQQRQFYAQLQLNFDEQIQGARGSKNMLGFREDAANQLIREALIKQEADKRAVKVSNIAVGERFKAQYDQFLSDVGFSEKDFQEFLRTAENQQILQEALYRVGFLQLQRGTYGEFREELRKVQERAIRSESLEKVVVGEITPTDLELIDFANEHKSQYQNQILGPYAPTDAEILAYFEKHKDKYALENARIRHIQINLAKDASEADVKAANDKLQNIQKELKGGKTFDELALAHSDDEFSKLVGGVVDFFQFAKSIYDTDSDKSFSEAAFSQPIGERHIVRSAKGLHLLEVLERKLTEFDAVKDDVKQDLTTEVQDGKFASWYDAAKKAETFPQTDEVHARHILISAPQNATPDQLQTASRKLDQVIVKLKDGADFAELAKEYSDDASNKGQGGDLGWFGHGRMVSEFDQAAFALEVNKISEPVRTQYGYHIIQVLEQRKTDANKSSITNAFISSKENENFQNWLKETTAAAKIEYKDPLIYAYNFETKAREAEGLDEKLKLLDEAVKAYSEAKQGITSISVTDPFIGYYQSAIHQQKAELLKDELEKIAEELKKEEKEVPAEQKKSFEDRIAQEKRLQSERFLESASNYGELDAFLFESAVADDKENPELRYQYALFLRNIQSKDDDAYGQLTEALALNPKNVAAMELAADIKASQGSYDLASGHLEAALKLVKPDTREQQGLQLKLAGVQLEMGRLARSNTSVLGAAEKTLLELKAKLPETDRSYAGLLATLGDVYMELGKFDDAEKAFKDSLKQSNRAEVEVKLGRALLGGKHFDEAERTLKRVAEHDIYSIEARIALGDVYLEQKKTDDALKQYKDALSLNAPASRKIELGKKILGIAPTENEIRLTLAETLAQEKRISESREQYELVLQADPKSWRAQKGLGFIYKDDSEFRLAMDTFKSALLNQPPIGEQIAINLEIIKVEEVLVGQSNPLGIDGQEAIFNLAEIYGKQGNYVEARKRLDELKNKYPEYQPERVAALLEQIDSTAALSSDGLPGQKAEDQGRTHINIGETHAAYSSVPPTSGPHYPNIAAYGVATDAIPNELQIHNLEHGAVILQYQPAHDKTEVEKMTTFITDLRKQSKYCKLILAPYPDLDKPIAVTAWGRVLKLDKFDEAPVTGFINEFIEKGPEKVNDCR